tara:strand:- start:574 stop:1197 length:624 start_codon:yes stop_codon:yes gene_type:complete
MARIEGVQAEIIRNIYERALNKKGHSFFESKSYNLNIIGVRASKNFTNLFDDAIVVIYKNAKGWWVVDTYEATTDPGKDSLTSPLSKSGCAILVPGQYKSTYKLDLHGGKYLALCQRGGKVKVYRDNNRNKKYELNKNSIEEGMFGINIHRSKRSGDTKYVNSFSAGCQVFKNAKDYYEFIDTCQVAADRFNNSFTYTLICEEDLDV